MLIYYTFGLCYGPLVYLMTMWYIVPRKIWQTWFSTIYFDHRIVSAKLIKALPLSLLRKSAAS
jgi:hypothetical protein